MPKAVTARKMATAAFSNLSQRCFAGARCTASMGTISEAASRTMTQWGNTLTRPGNRLDAYTSMAISTMGHRGSSFDDCDSWLIAGVAAHDSRRAGFGNVGQMRATDMWATPLIWEFCLCAFGLRPSRGPSAEWNEISGLSSAVPRGGTVVS